MVFQKKISFPRIFFRDNGYTLENIGKDKIMKDFDETFYIDTKEALAFEKLGRFLSLLLRDYTKKPIFLCIGSDRVTGDSLGPLVGSSLEEERRDISVLGTLKFPVHALNLNETLTYIHQKFPEHPVVAIDASLGTRDHQGFLTVGRGSLEPGAGVNKILGFAGDIFITGIVAQAGPFSQMTLQTVRLSFVLFLADIITKGILLAWDAQKALPANCCREL